jgi:hypothetical protein
MTGARVDIFKKEASQNNSEPGPFNSGQLFDPSRKKGRQEGGPIK